MMPGPKSPTTSSNVSLDSNRSGAAGATGAAVSSVNTSGTESSVRPLTFGVWPSMIVTAAFTRFTPSDRLPEAKVKE